QGVDVKEAEGGLAAGLEGLVEAGVDGAVEAGGLAAHREHVDPDDQQAGAGEPRLVVATAAEQRAELVPRRGGALDEQREQGHEVRLAAAEAAVDEATVLLAAVEDLPHVGEDPRQLLLDGGGDDIVVDEPRDFVGPGSALAQLDDEAHGPDV